LCRLEASGYSETGTGKKPEEEQNEELSKEQPKE
jgi:hypothetical protein